MTPNKMGRQILLELLHLYKNLPYLWDPTHRLYTHREARDRGWALLLEKYQTIEEDATIDALKKKIDNMRTAYRRELKKVIDAQIRGNNDYKPHLWYYHSLSFLHNENDDRVKTEADGSYQEYEELDEVILGNENDENSLSENEMSPLPKKKNKYSSVYTQVHNTQDGSIVNTSNINLNDSHHSHFKKEEEEEVFGRTIGLQLKDLNPTQKFIAEKLISEVIFHGRLEQLNTNSRININLEIQSSQ